MKPKLLNQVKPMTTLANMDKIIAFADNTGYMIKNTDVNISDLVSSIKLHPSVSSHINNSNLHVTVAEKTNINNTINIVSTHTNNEEIHVSEYDRANWNSKETVAGAQTKANQVQSNLNTHINSLTIHVTPNDKINWSNKYTKEEVDNLLSAIEYGNDWKEAVATFADIAKKYTDPFNGWTVNVKDTNITYRFDGSTWIPISANAIPTATPTVSGLMSKEDKTKLNGVAANANNYVHPSNTSTRHVSDAQISFWDLKAENTLSTIWANGLMSKEDKTKLDSVAVNATNYVHPDKHPASMITTTPANRFVSDAQILSWDGKASGTVVNHTSNGLMLSSDKYKLDGIEAKANAYTHPSTHLASMIVDIPLKRFVTDDQINMWTNRLATSKNIGLMSIADRLKLDDIEFKANNYIHPEVHPATVIATDESHRFVTDLEKSKWNDMKPFHSFIQGSATFNSTTGVEIVHNIGTLSYTVNITLTSFPNGEVNDVWVTKQNNNIKVYCSGTSTSCTFDYTIIKY